MLYVGLPLEYEECARLLNGRSLPEGVIMDIHGYLKQQNSKLQYFTIRGRYNILGFGIFMDEMPVEKLCILLLSLKTQFAEEAKALKLDLSRVAIAHMDLDPEIVEFPSIMALHY